MVHRPRVKSACDIFKRGWLSDPRVVVVLTRICVPWPLGYLYRKRFNEAYIGVCD